ncbi:MAG: circadian clock KaiB family protein [Patescibacteria group bacterium]
MADKRKILFFVSQESAIYNFVRRQVEVACSQEPGMDLEIIDIAEHPELAEQYNIEALPTLIIGDKRFVGQPTSETLAICLHQPPQGA